jgi:hypothetical protein
MSLPVVLGFRMARGTTADPATHLSVHASAIGGFNVVAGTTFPVTVTALDQSNNTATGYHGTVHFTCAPGDTGATVPPNSTLAAGVGVFDFVLTDASINQAITAADTVTSTITGSQPGVTVYAATPSQYGWTVPDGTVSDPWGVSCLVQDQYGNTCLSYNGSATFYEGGDTTIPGKQTQLNAGHGFGAVPQDFTFSSGTLAMTVQNSDATSGDVIQLEAVDDAGLLITGSNSPDVTYT